MNMLIWAINAAGLNRAKIRDVLAYRPAWPGVTGDIPFSAVLDDMGDVFLAEVREGQLDVPLARAARHSEDLHRPARSH